MKLETEDKIAKEIFIAILKTPIIFLAAVICLFVGLPLGTIALVVLAILFSALWS